MDEQDKKKKEFMENQHNDFEFMKEKIKERPVNKRKLLRKTVITASMAGIFGLVACFTFLVLEPVFSNWLYPEEEPKTIVFPEEKEEILPEDMLQEGNTNTDPEEQTPSPIVQKVPLEVTDYIGLYEKLYDIAEIALKSIVTVTGVTSDVDWFDNAYENKGQTSGLIVYDSGKELYILVDYLDIEDAENLYVNFGDSKQIEATFKKKDYNTDLAIVSVMHSDIEETTLAALEVAQLGNSNANNMIGSPIITIGNTMGYNNSVAYGIITSVDYPIHMIDTNYKMITTDIYGSENASGIIIDLSGKVLGMIDNRHNNENTNNLISAIGISEFKKTMEGLLGTAERGMIGVYGKDVTLDANSRLGVPMGAYVTAIEMDSPAMNSGIQSGDVIVKVGNSVISSFTDYSDAILKYKPNVNVTITIMRNDSEEYKEIELDITLETQKKRK